MSDLMRHYEQLAAEEDRLRRRQPTNEDCGFKQFDGCRFLTRFPAAASQANWDGDLDTSLRIAMQEYVRSDLWESTIAAFNKGISLCESPIEKSIFPWLLCQPYSCFEQLPRVLTDGESDLKPYTVAVIPQLKIGRRRADFALAAKRGGPTRFVIVECDGEDFHKDVHKDVERDAELMQYNRVLDVHPLTGKEIFKDAQAAAWSASRALTNAWSKLNKGTQHKFGQGASGR